MRLKLNEAEWREDEQILRYSFMVQYLILVNYNIQFINFFEIVRQDFTDN